MEQIRIKDEELQILKSGIVFKKKLLSVKAGNYLKRLKAFENKHKMKSETFLNKFNTGKLGDDEEWFDWLFVYEAYNRITEQKKIIDGMSL